MSTLGIHVTRKEKFDKRVIQRLKNLYKDNFSVPVNSVKKIRMSLQQGDLPSMHLFSFGIDPILGYLRLTGLLFTLLPLLSLVLAGCPPFGPLEDRFKVFGYADDVKAAITSME